MAVKLDTDIKDGGMVSIGSDVVSRGLEIVAVTLDSEALPGPLEAESVL